MTPQIKGTTFVLKFKPHIQKEIDDGVILPRFKIRLLTPAERDAREAERTKDFRLCVCCQIKRGPGDRDG